jgi:hypothetical protein
VKLFRHARGRRTAGGEAHRRAPDRLPRLHGHTAAAGLSSKGAKSKTIDLEVSSDVDLGLPAYTWTGHGPLLLDKIPVADTTVDGHVMLDPKFKAQGLLTDSSDFGTGLVKGKIRLKSKSSTTPKLALTLEADRKLSLKASLTDPIEPVLSVTPISRDFGALHLDQSLFQLFSVTNVGVGTLSGAASFTAATDDFQLIGTPTYTDLAPGDPPVMIAVAFNPQTAGSKTATVHFGTDTSVGARNVTVRGVGGIPIITVDPEFLAFDDPVAHVSRTITVTVTNDGDAVLTGRARLSGSSAFALSGRRRPSVSQISYTLAPDESKTFDVRFTPTAQGDCKLAGPDRRRWQDRRDCESSIWGLPLLSRAGDRSRHPLEAGYLPPVRRSCSRLPLPVTLLAQAAAASRPSRAWQGRWF